MKTYSGFRQQVSVFLIGAAVIAATLLTWQTTWALPGSGIGAAPELQTPTAELGLPDCTGVCLFLPAVGGRIPVAAVPGQAVKILMVPKFLGLEVFDRAHAGAQEAAADLQNPAPLQYLGPSLENNTPSQVEIVTTAIAQGVDAILIANNVGDDLVPAAKAARAAGISVVTWDSPIPAGEGEQLFAAQVDFDETGRVMADMALDILGAGGGKLALLSAAPDAAAQNGWIVAMKEVLKESQYSKLELVDTVYGNDRFEDSYNQALLLVDKYPGLKLIMAPTSVGIVAAAKAMQDEGICAQTKVSGLGLPDDMKPYTLNGCAPEFALWSFVDLGYVTYYATYLLATGAIKGVEGELFHAGRMGDYIIQKDPTRAQGLRIVMGPFLIYTKDNIDQKVE